MKTFPVLLVDDEQAILRAVRMTLLTSEVEAVEVLDDSRSVMPLLAKRDFGVVLLDLTMPHLSGQQLLKEIGEQHPDTPVIVMTATNDLETAVQCMKDGAVDYLLKPVENVRLVSAVKRALELRALQAEISSLKDMALSEPRTRHEAFSQFLTHSQELSRIFRYLETVAPTSHPVLITGENGTGKELVARAVHRISARTGEFVPVSLAGLDDSLFSDALFGRAQGSSDAAARARTGRVNSAVDGTLFLDDIGELSVPSQMKLLRLLQDGTFYRSGADKVQLSRARIVCATDRDLAKDTVAGTFRPALYHRLAVHQVHLPPLRARHGDLPLLVTNFLEKAASNFGRTVPTVPRELFQLLGAYRFPGNVRELEGMCEVAIARHTRGVLSLQSFRDAIAQHQSQSEPIALGSESVPGVRFPDPLPTLAEMETALVDEAMRRAGKNQKIAASLIGIKRQALNRRVLKRRKRGKES